MGIFELFRDFIERGRGSARDFMHPLERREEKGFLKEEERYAREGVLEHGRREETEERRKELGRHPYGHGGKIPRSSRKPFERPPLALLYPLIRDLIIASLLLGTFILFAVLGFVLFGGKSFEAAKNTVLTSIGVGATTLVALIFLVFFIHTGVGVIVGVIDWFSKFLKWRKTERDLERLTTQNPFISVAGGGRVGEAILKQLSEKGRKVVMIEIDEFRAKELRKKYNKKGIITINDNALHKEAFLEARIKKAKVLYGALNSDQNNIDLILLAKLLNPKLRIISHAHHEDAVSLMEQAGAFYVVFLEIITATRMIENAGKLRAQDPLIMVAGGGRVGEAILKQLSEKGRKAVMIEIDEFRAKELEKKYGKKEIIVINDNALHKGALLKAGIKKAKVLYVVLNSDQNDINLILHAKFLNPKLRIISHAHHEDAVSLMEQAGASSVVFPDIPTAIKMIDNAEKSGKDDLAGRSIELFLEEMISALKRLKRKIAA